MVYYRANPDVKRLSYYWHEDDECPKDLEWLGDEELDVICFINSSEESQIVTIEIRDDNLYDLYCLLSKRESFTNGMPLNVEFEISDKEIKTFDDCLYDDILEAIKIHLAEDMDEDEFRFKIPVSYSLFRSNL